jgi:hypothetical protein
VERDADCHLRPGRAPGGLRPLRDPGRSGRRGRSGPGHGPPGRRSG